MCGSGISVNISQFLLQLVPNKRGEPVFTGVDVVVILLVVAFILYLANPSSGDLEIKVDPMVLMIVLVTVLMFAITL